MHLPLLRNLRSIHIEVMLDTSSHFTVKRPRARLAYFTDMLKLHSNGTNRKPLLQNLHIEVCWVTVATTLLIIVPIRTPQQTRKSICSGSKASPL
jgi:hypothetical protein